MIRPEFPTLTTPEFDSERAVRFGAGAAVAPLWTAFAMTAAAGAAFWWMTAWTRRPEARSFAPQDPADAAPEAVMAHQPEVVTEPAAEPVAEPTVAPEEVMEHAPVEAAAFEPAPAEASAEAVSAPTAEEAAPTPRAAVQAAVEAVTRTAPKPPRRKPAPQA